MKIGALYALLSIITWAIISVITRFCIIYLETNILVFATLQIFSAGVALLLIRKPVTRDGWRSGVKYSWLYTILQICRNFFLAAIYLSITSTETSLLINGEIIVTTILAYIFFKRRPHPSNIFGMLVILVGIILFIQSLPENIQLRVSILISLAVIASCTRAIVVEKTTIASPNTTTRQKCGISGFTMFWGGIIVMSVLTVIAIGEHIFAPGYITNHPEWFYLPRIEDILHPTTIVSACITGFTLTALSTYLYYATLKTATAETFMTFRAFQPMLTYGLESLIAIYAINLKPELDTRDYILGCVIILGSFLILLMPPRRTRQLEPKQYMTD
ncbi:EamA family transporter [Butyricimonas synergistica]|uniref:EamA family transporter n=1 Tax=Butyricimonas synergistica TaxID=544644 RepID=UPI0003665570|nr:EamA family transporter [Butyricimonas synergistica]